MTVQRYCPVIFSKRSTSTNRLIEIRNQVYRWLSQPIKGWTTTVQARRSGNSRIGVELLNMDIKLRLASIIWTCRQLRTEFMSIWLPPHSISTGSLDVARRWSTLGPEFVRFLTEFNIYFNAAFPRPGGRYESMIQGPRYRLPPSTTNLLPFRATYLSNGSGQISLSFEFSNVEAPPFNEMTITSRSRERIVAALCRAFPQAEHVTFENFVLITDTISILPVQCLIPRGHKLDSYPRWFSYDHKRALFEELHRDSMSTDLDRQHHSRCTVEVSQEKPWQMSFKMQWSADESEMDRI